MSLSPSLVQFRPRRAEGFSLLEMLVSVSIIIVLMAIIFGFINLNQKQYRSQELNAEVSQGGRSAFEVMTQELNQAGLDPAFSSNKTLSGAVSPTVGTINALPISSSGSPATHRIFYGSQIVIGNDCGSGATPACDQETVTVTGSASYPLTSTTAPVILTNSHQSGEPIFDRNFPYANGILYNNYSACNVSLLGQPACPNGFNAVAVNSVKFFGDIENTGDLYYGEYRLEKATSSGLVPACDSTNAASMSGPFVLTRFLTKLANPPTSASSVFAIPANKAAAFDGAIVSPIVNNIQGYCASTANVTVNGTAYTFTGWPLTLVDETSATSVAQVTPAVTTYSGNTPTAWVDPVVYADTSKTPPIWAPVMWMKMQTYGMCDATTSPCTPYYQSYVTDVQVTLTVLESQTDPVTGKKATQVLQVRIVPKNINDALGVALNGGAAFLPGIPKDPTTGNTLPIN